MNEPLALLLCTRGVVATQLTQRLEALRYRLAVIATSTDLVNQAESQQAMIVLVDADGLAEGVLEAIAQLRGASATAHIPVIAFARELDDAAQAQLVAKGAAVAVNESAVLGHLPQLLARALEIP